MDSWRISVSTQDLSSIPNANQGEVGAMVIRASKGTADPVYFGRGQENRIITWFGNPSTAYPEVYEAIQYNKVAPIWIAAPPATVDTMGGVMVSTTGTTHLASGVTPASYNVGYTFANTTNDYFLVTSVSPFSSTDVPNLAVSVTYSTYTTTFTMTLYAEDANSQFQTVNSYEFSLTPGFVDGFGRNVYADEIFKDNDYIKVKVNTAATFSTTVNDTNYVAFAGGSRTAGTAITDGLLTASWDFFEQKNNYAADIFMDPTGKAAIAQKFSTLATTYQKYSAYICALADNQSASAITTIKNAYAIDNPLLAFYWNWGRVKDTWNKSDFWTSLVGKIGTKYALMQDVYNGLAPSYIDENGHGGQLGSGIIELRYEPTDAEQQSLDAAGINPLIYDNFYGVMVAGQKSGKNPKALSDNSWVAHTRLFSYLKRAIIDRVLTQQITKLNDSKHRFLAQSGTEAIIRPLLSLQLLADAQVLCSEKNNPPEILAQRKFVLSVAVKVTPFSEYLQLNFINVGQTTDVSTVL